MALYPSLYQINNRVWLREQAKRWGARLPNLMFLTLFSTR